MEISTSGITYGLMSASFINNIGFVVGEYGTILKTQNYGNTWTNLLSGTTLNLLSVCMSDTNIIYVVGNNGIILKTINGGKTWSFLKNNLPSYNLNAVSYADANTGYAVGANGNILTTDNGGENWNYFYSGTNNEFSSVTLCDNGSGYVVGKYGTIIQTIDNFIIEHLNNNDDDSIHDLKNIDQFPEFPGGIIKLYEFLGQKIKYPEIELMNEIRGTVYTQFVVGKDGKITDVKIARSAGKGLDQEAIRVVKLLPNWIPGKKMVYQ